MTVQLITDPTEPGFNSFVSVAEADEYFSGVYFGSSASWDELDPEDKARLLITASRALSTLSWTGAAVGPLAFPRVYSTQFLANPVVPEFVSTLVLEWAKWLYQEGPNSNSGSEAPVSEVKVGDLAIKFGGSLTGPADMPQMIVALLQTLSPTYLNTNKRARSLSMRY